MLTPMLLSVLCKVARDFLMIGNGCRNHREISIHNFIASVFWKLYVILIGKPKGRGHTLDSFLSKVEGHSGRVKTNADG